jgi:hypothetical protein
VAKGASGRRNPRDARRAPARQPGEAHEPAGGADPAEVPDGPVGSTPPASHDASLNSAGEEGRPTGGTPEDQLSDGRP